ncbi:short-chain dehydrogenase reductase ATA1-like [Cornus florida]|uniref:short-chain dehydrogenase reductase ATA1-like n=1 Tax=Cornus florida TaxID=4283 RepID=UPI0028978003|nr:short-chain dehydrogenase reductase ATA1-like [Cornus florida]XP_059655255.1 short-chain dehydrogenase reductase ATA1-like [Cornus florida]XP_059655256.1 short-chain dehydrogenase reductase ATA1-like [Cornus florida]XP_059655258.1 short-chain dehydrogenase reductase ATA1-like [Cornus florida]XP_059655259.1 short-chain dehydrogenase reductase ATA1-like [Cornus florida]XP_059655260.1 short-chain dehydrogenase reductase ATA1-like [Cornus florida]XP_059655261.1 short-chain dehydrogenase reduct
MELNGDGMHNMNAQMLYAKRLLGKVAVVTGGARGIGAATAKLFVENGAHVVFADILDDLGATLADSIGGRHIHRDVAKESDVESAVELAVTWKGHLDIMFNNAGISGHESRSITNLNRDHMKALRRFLGKRDVSTEEVSRIVGESASLLRGRSGRLEDVAQAVLFLASDEAGFITAHNLVVDGGYTSAATHMSFIYQGQ